MRRSSFFPALVLALSALAAGAGSAAAAGPPGAPPGSAAALKASGDELMREKRYAEALAAYEAAAQSRPDPTLHYNRGRALQFMGRYPEALAAFRSFKAEAPVAVLSRVPTLDEIVAEVHAHVALLRLRCEVSGARVLLAHQEIGRTPFAAPLAVNAGHATLEILAEGYEPFSTEIDLPGGEVATLVVAKLKSRNTMGVLVITSKVPGTLAAVDGQTLGVAPAEAKLPAGDHAVTATHEGYGPASTHVVLVAGERKELVLDPIAPTPVYKRWWLWTTLGVVAAGAVVTAVTLTTERPPTTGTFSPGQIRF
jgi:hypothetical protein